MLQHTYKSDPTYSENQHHWLKRIPTPSKDWMLKLVLKHENTKNKYSITKDSEKYCQNITLHNSDENEPSKRAKHVRNDAKVEGLKRLQHTWQQKPLHGQYPARTNQTDVDTQKTHQWLSSSCLKAETEGFIIAAQDQSLYTRNYQAQILKNGVDPTCRCCGKFDETVDNLVSGCPVLAPKEYIDRLYGILFVIFFLPRMIFHTSSPMYTLQGMNSGVILVCFWQSIFG